MALLQLTHQRQKRAAETAELLVQEQQVAASRAWQSGWYPHPVGFLPYSCLKARCAEAAINLQSRATLSRFPRRKCDLCVFPHASAGDVISWVLLCLAAPCHMAPLLGQAQHCSTGRWPSGHTDNFGRCSYEKRLKHTPYSWGWEVLGPPEYRNRKRELR